MRIELTLVVIASIGDPVGSLRVGQVIDESRAPDADTVELVAEFRLGGVETDEVLFGSIASVHVTPDGEIWVADRLGPAIDRFSSEGKFLGSVGRPGGGPGEIGRVLGLAAHPSGGVAAWDVQSHRVHVFSVDGDFERDFRVAVEAEFDSFADPLLVIDSRGRYHILTVRLHGDEPPWTPRLLWLILGEGGEILDRQDYPSANRVGTFQPLTTRTVVSPDGNLVSGRNDRLEFFSVAGDDTVRVVSASAVGVRYWPEELREVQAREEVFASRQGRRPRDIPATKPVWGQFSIDVDGRLWLQRHVLGRRERGSDRLAGERGASGFFEFQELPPMEWGEDVVYDVIAPTGEYRWSIRIPNSWTPASEIPRERVVFARGEQVWTVRRGAFDEETVVQYRIRR